MTYVIHQQQYYLIMETDIKRIQNWLGHSSYNTTANIYTHLDKSANVVTGDVVSNLLKL